jgi:hypothetical protein
LWKYIGEKICEEIEAILPHKKYMKPVDIYKDDVLYKSFICIKDAAKDMNVNISMCRKFLSGDKKDPKNYEWKFKQ